MMNYASNFFEARHHLKGETTDYSGHCDKTTDFSIFSAFSASLRLCVRKTSPPTAVFRFSFCPGRIRSYEPESRQWGRRTSPGGAKGIRSYKSTPPLDEAFPSLRRSWRVTPVFDVNPPAGAIPSSFEANMLYSDSLRVSWSHIRFTLDSPWIHHLVNGW